VPNANDLDSASGKKGGIPSFGLMTNYLIQSERLLQRKTSIASKAYKILLVSTMMMEKAISSISFRTKRLFQ
jgi:hypothetical protein